MNFDTQTYRTTFTAQKRITAWSAYSDPHMVVLSEQPQFLALHVIIAYLAAYQDGSRRNAFLASHGWVKTFLSMKKGHEVANLRGLMTYLERHPRQAALLLESEHILMSREEREARIRSAYGYFVGRDCQHILEMIECYLNAVHFVLEERRYDEQMTRVRAQERKDRLERLVVRVRTLKARSQVVNILETVKSVLALDKTAKGRIFGVDIRHWRYLVAPLE